jgi:hypothetical protein
MSWFEQALAEEITARKEARRLNNKERWLRDARQAITDDEPYGHTNELQITASFSQTGELLLAKENMAIGAYKVVEGGVEFNPNPSAFVAGTPAKLETEEMFKQHLWRTALDAER